MAFDSEPELAKFKEERCPGGQIIAKWQCKVCHKWHFWAVGVGDPAGASSGTTRTSRNIETIKERFFKSAVAKTIP
jgi:hypothetical protein